MEPVQVERFYLGCLAHASYLLGDEASATAIVVDPQRDIQQYVADAERLGLHIRHVFYQHRDAVIVFDDDIPDLVDIVQDADAPDNIGL